MCWGFVTLVFRDVGNAPISPRLHRKPVFPRIKRKLPRKNPRLILSPVIFSSHTHRKRARRDVLHGDARPAALLLSLVVIVFDESFRGALPLSFAVEGSKDRPPPTCITVSVLILVIRYYLRPEFFVNFTLRCGHKLINNLGQHSMPRYHILFLF